MKKRFLAILLCLSVLLMACACAAETMEPPAVSETESKAPAPQFTISEVNAESSKTEEPAAPSETAPAESEPQETISMEESDIELEPIQPVDPIQPVEPVLPEERETTLELVQEFTLGEDGIPFYLLYDTDPSNAQIFVPYNYLMDEDGQLYMYMEDKLCAFGDDQILRVKDSNDTSYAYASSMLALDGKIYVLYNNGILSTYTMEKGLQSTVRLSMDKNEVFDLFAFEDSPMVRIDSKTCRPSGTKTTLPFAFSQADKAADSTLSFDCAQYALENYPRVLNYSEGLLTVKSYQNKWFEFREGGRHTIDETMVYQFDEAGNPISRFKISEISCPKDLPCEVVLGDATCEWCSLSTVVIGKTVFEGVYKKNIFSGADGSLYIMLVYTYGAKLYRINPGYTDVDFTDWDSLEDPYYSCINCQEAEGGSSSASALSVTGNAQTQATEIIVPTHPAFSRERVLARVNDMKNVTWQLLNGHLTERIKIDDETGAVYRSEKPYYISQATVGDVLTGIPYCHGGLNGYDNISETTYKLQRFEDLIDDEYSTGQWYTAGNINHVGLISRTIGVDCSGLVGSAYGHTQKIGVDHTMYYGHMVTNYSELQCMDLLVHNPETGKRNHVMLFYGFSQADQTVTVIDCTGGGLTLEMIRLGIGQPDNKVDSRTFPLDYLEEYCLRQALYSFSTTATHHTYSCSHVDDEGNQCTPAVTEEHDWVIPDETKPNERFCIVCNYCVQHVFTYKVSSNGHVGTCTLCGYITATIPHEFEVTGVAGAHFFDCSLCGFSSGPLPHTFGSSYTHTATQHTRTCSECGYSISTAHTFTYTTYSGIVHTKACSVCGYSTTAMHNFVYDYNEDGHWRECTDCGYETAMSAHTYANSRCTVCNMQMLMKAPPVIAIPEEDEPLPVPEDQKATL